MAVSLSVLFGLRKRRRAFFVILALINLVIILDLTRRQSTATPDSGSTTSSVFSLLPTNPFASSTSTRSLRRRAQRSFASTIASDNAVVILDLNGFHDEVHSAVLHTMSQFDGLDIRFYRGNWRYGMADAVDGFWHTLPRHPSTFLDDLRRDTSIRHIIMTTCDWDWFKLRDELHDIWEEREQGQKFNVVCMRHFLQGHLAREISWLAERDSISQVALGDHVVRHLDLNINSSISYLKKWQGSEKACEGLKRMPIKTFIPTFPSTSYPQPGDAVFDPRDENDSSLRTAFIQSTTWDADHRNITGIYADLLRNLAGELRPCSSQSELMEIRGL